MKKFLIAFPVIVVAVVGLAVHAGWDLWEVYQKNSAITAVADLAKQDDSLVEIPAQQPLEPRPPNPLLT